MAAFPLFWAYGLIHNRRKSVVDSIEKNKAPTMATIGVPATILKLLTTNVHKDLASWWQRKLGNKAK